MKVAFTRLHSSEAVLQRCFYEKVFWKMEQIYRRAPMPKSYFNKVVMVAPWCRSYRYCTTSFSKAWTQVLGRFKSCSRHVGAWGSLTMVPAGIKAKRLSSINHATKTIHHWSNISTWVFSFKFATYFQNTSRRLLPKLLSKLKFIYFFFAIFVLDLIFVYRRSNIFWQALRAWPNALTKSLILSYTFVQ